MPNWKKYKLGELAKKELGLVDGPFGSNLPASEYTNSGIPVIRGTNLSLGKQKFNDDGFVFVSDKTAERLKRSICKPGDILFTKKGTLGQIGIIPKRSKFQAYLLSSNQMKFSVDESKANKDFIYYYLSSEEAISKIRRESESTGVPKINLGYLKNFELNIPEDLPTQIRIASILSALDDKIELNRRMNHTLEQLAQTLFEKYFIANIDPDNLPEGWRLSSLDLIADYLNGIALQKFRPKDEVHYLPVIKIKELKNGISTSTEKADIDIPQQYIINDGDVLFSWSGSLEVDLWCGGKGALNQHLFKVSSRKFPKWFYYLWTKQHLIDFKNIAASKATTMGHIQRHHLTEAEVYVPSNALLSKYDKIIAPMIDKIISNRIEYGRLSQIRDSLLPKLMNGEIEVN